MMASSRHPMARRIDRGGTTARRVDLISPDELRHGLAATGFRDAVVDAQLFSLTMRFSGRTPAR
jgi:hypothetical protein